MLSLPPVPGTRSPCPPAPRRPTAASHVRIGGCAGVGGARGDPAGGRWGLGLLGGIRRAVCRVIGFEGVALRLGFALERAELTSLTVVRGRLLLQLIEAGDYALVPSAG